MLLNSKRRHTENGYVAEKERKNSGAWIEENAGEARKRQKAPAEENVHRGSTWIAGEDLFLSREAGYTRVVYIRLAVKVPLRVCGAESVVGLMRDSESKADLTRGKKAVCRASQLSARGAIYARCDLAKTDSDFVSRLGRRGNFISIEARESKSDH